MPDLEAFEVLVKQNIKLLAAKDAKTRRQAAQWLGEAGDPTAITALAQAYKNDPDPSVRESARYALGMFRKLKEELDGPNSDKVIKLLQDVALKGKMGGRSLVSSRGLVKLMLGLLLSAILVAVLSFVLPSVLQPTAASNQNTTQSTSTPPVVDKDRATLLAEIGQTWRVMAGEGNTLLQQFQAAQGGTALDCTITLTNPPAFVLSANNRNEFSDLAEIVDTLNTAQASMSSAETAFQQACSAGGSVSAEAAGTQVTALQAMMELIPQIGQKLAAAESQAASIEQPTTAPVDTAATEPPPATDATTGLNIRPHLVALQAIIDDMTASDGPANTLNQYWTDSKSPTGTAGCNDQVAASDIPADYVLPADVQSLSDLVLAANLVNTGLAATRQGRDLFASTCPFPSPSADQGLTFASTANTAFSSAANLLATLRVGA